MSISQQTQTLKVINKEIASTQTCHSMKTQVTSFNIFNNLKFILQDVRK